MFLLTDLLSYMNSLIEVHQSVKVYEDEMGHWTNLIRLLVSCSVGFISTTSERFPKVVDQLEVNYLHGGRVQKPIAVPEDYLVLLTKFLENGGGKSVEEFQLPDEGHLFNQSGYLMAPLALSRTSHPREFKRYKVRKCAWAFSVFLFSESARTISFR